MATNQPNPRGRGLLHLLCRRRVLAGTFLVAVFLFNLIAYMHAYSMTHYVRGAVRTPSPDKLTVLDKAFVLLAGVKIPRPESTETPSGAGLDFTTHHFATGDSSELEAWHIAHANSKGLVLLFHGYGACKANMLRETNAFDEMGFATMLVDFSGSGGSSGSDTTVGVREAEEVARAVEYARAQWPKNNIILYGQSMGSAAILRAVSVDGVRPAAVLLECPFNRLLTTVENRFSAMGVPSFPAARLLVFWGGVQNGFDGFTHNPASYAKDVTCPSLIMVGSEDPFVKIADAKEVFDNLAGKKRFEVLEGVKHEAYVHARPQQWRECVEQFLSSHLSADANK
jgi:alpha-beta hydrolase superfamily lysophospholipase